MANSTTTTTQLYVVMTPVKGGGIAPSTVTDDLGYAKYEAQKLRANFERKGWTSWAERVAIKAPKTAAAYTEMAEAVAEQIEALGNNSYRTRPLINACSALHAAAVAA